MMMTYCSNARRRRGTSSQFNIFDNQKPENEETMTNNNNNRNIANSYDNRSFLLESFPDYNTLAECILHTDCQHQQLQQPIHHHTRNQLFTTSHKRVTKSGFINSNNTTNSGNGGGNSGCSCSIEETSRNTATIISDNQTRVNTHGAISNNKNSSAAAISSSDVVLTIENKLPPIINDLCCNSSQQNDSCFSSTTATITSVATASLYTKVNNKKPTLVKQHSTIKGPFTFSTSTTITTTRSKKDFFNVYDNDALITFAASKNSAENKSQQVSIFDGSEQNKTTAWSVMAPITTNATTTLSKEERKAEEEAVDVGEKTLGYDTKEIVLEIGKLCEEGENTPGEDEDDDQDTVKALPTKPLRRIQRSLTNDERMMTFNHQDDHQSKEKSPLLRCKSIDSPQSLGGSIVDENHHFIKMKAGDRKTSVPSKRRGSKKKILQRSMSLGFSKFKSLAFFKPHHQRFNDEDIQLEFNDADHQTSRRKNTVTSNGDLPSPKPKMDENGDEDKSSIDDSFEKFDKLTGNQLNNYPPLMRSLSAPDPIDDKFDQAEDEYDEDISKLYLPRRRAICPNLPVPAMKQLKTYLILTRLKQYCFV